MIKRVPIHHQQCKGCIFYRRLTGREGICKEPSRALNGIKGGIRGTLSRDWCPSWQDGRHETGT